MSLDDLDLHSSLQLYETSKTPVSIFLEILQLISMKVSVLPQSVGLMKFMLNIFCTSTV